MPAADPDDQRDARAFERSLREDVLAGRTDRSQLDWFVALPKRVRRSLRLIVETAKRDFAQPERHSTNHPSRSLSANPQLKVPTPSSPSIKVTQQLTPIPPRPRDLSCLKGDGTAWNGLGRRKKRCRAFCAIGRAYVRQQTVSRSPTPAPVLALEAIPVLPTRPVTPPGLRESVYSSAGLLSIANGPATYGLNTPAPPTPSVPAPVHPGRFRAGEWMVLGRDVNPDYAFIVALGHHARAPEDGFFLSRAAVAIVNVEERTPGLLQYIADGLFPGGLKDGGEMLEPYYAVLDFCRGWFEFACRRGLVPL
ncbi:hypothetical protein RhiJN_16097 [Ceratobasidium sp. AG-Ba]|nr:hypothetical protein RhiJN_05138 [Ceratobasidium sp. AG-Ba]QRV88079.1 hypothetical protein RhiJN_16097 [Ceratobasidium sp. AG-Ba]